MRTLLACLSALGVLAENPPVRAEPPSTKRQIAIAVQAAPEESRDGARVLGFNGKGDVVELRKGTNELVCLADDPKRDKLNVACYHRDLEPYMARGRALKKSGKNGQESLKLRWAEIDAGTLKMPREPRTLYVLSGDGFDAKAGTLTNPYLRWVIYTPYATPETTGLSTKSSENAPWLMFPGTAGAHIMITPARSQ